MVINFYVTLGALGIIFLIAISGMERGTKLTWLLIICLALCIIEQPEWFQLLTHRIKNLF